MTTTKKHLMYVLISNLADCTNGGITRQKGSINVWEVRREDGHLLCYNEVQDFVRQNPIIEDDDLILATPYRRQLSFDNPPAAKWAGALRHGHVMDGGSYVETSNAVVTDSIGYKYPISVHDRRD